MISIIFLHNFFLNMAKPKSNYPCSNEFHTIYAHVLGHFSHVRFFATPPTAHWAPLPMGFSRKEYWIGLPFPPPGDLPDPGIEPGSPALQADSLPSKPPGKPFTSFFFITVRIWKRYKYPSTGKWINMTVYPYSGILCRERGKKEKK